MEQQCCENERTLSPPYRRVTETMKLLALVSDSRLPASYKTFMKIMSNQVVADSRMLRNSLTSLLQFPLKACSEIIIDFYFLVLTSMSLEDYHLHNILA